MDVDPALLQQATRLAELAGRGIAGEIQHRITAARAAKSDQETIETLQEIINELISERAAVIGIAQAFEEALIAERISDADIEFVTSQLLPRVEELLNFRGADADPDQIRRLLELLVSKELVKVLQVLGFNFREAIGRPLTDLVARHISTQGPATPDDPDAIQRLQLELQVTAGKVALDPDAYERFNALWTRPQTSSDG